MNNNEENKVCNLDNSFLNATKIGFILTLDRSKYLDYYVSVQPSIELLSVKVKESGGGGVGRGNLVSLS